jgi:hypothetical protein
MALPSRLVSVRLSNDTFASRAGRSDYPKREVGTFDGHQWGHPLAINGDLTRPPTATFSWPRTRDRPELTDRVFSFQPVATDQDSGGVDSLHLPTTHAPTA